MPKSNGREPPLSLPLLIHFHNSVFIKKERCRHKHTEKRYVFTADTISMEGGNRIGNYTVFKAISSIARNSSSVKCN